MTIIMPVTNNQKYNRHKNGIVSNDVDDEMGLQLKAVFNLCDPKSTGRVSIDHLLALASHYCGDSKELENVLRHQMDPTGRGTLGFPEFCRGVRSILNSKYRIKNRTHLVVDNNMMAPTPGAFEDNTVVATPRFVLNSPQENSSSTTGSKSQCSSMSDGESYECYGESGDMEVEAASNGQGDDSAINNSHQPITRHTWLRTSLRRSPNNSNKDNLPNRRWGSFRTSSKRPVGSNALASHLYRSSSFNSSGRSSTCDTADDMYSDVSLEEDVLGLNHKIQILEQEVNVLKDSANDDRYTRVKAENAALQARILMLEEQLREDQLRAEERFQDEQRRQRELMVRIEREKQLQIENCSIRLQSVELEAASGREEINRQRALIDRLRQERKEATERAIEAENNYVELKAQMQSLKENERRLIAERESNNQLLDELSKEIERLRSEARTPALPTTSPETLRLEELHAELESLRLENKQLKETNEELQAALITRSVEEGRSLLVDAQESLAAEFEAMSQDQSKEQELSTIEKMQKALKEQQDVNTQLRAYIEGILLNIVENSPQLLEVKHHRPS